MRKLLVFVVGVALAGLVATAVSFRSSPASSTGSTASWGVSVAFAGTDPQFSVKFDVPAIKAGQRAVVVAHVTPPAGYHLNKEFPTSVMFTPPSGIKTEKPKLTSADAKRFEESGADFEVALVSTVEGKQVVSGEMKFGVCSATACIPTREKVSFTLEVK